MAKHFWTSLISLMKRFVLSDSNQRYAPSVLVKAIDGQYQTQTHQSYLLPGQTLGKLLFIGKQSIIFHPVIDTPNPLNQELSIAELFSKCHQEFIFEFFLKSRHFRYLLFPMILLHRQHWVSVIYDTEQQALSLLDSSCEWVSKYPSQDTLVDQFRQVFQAYGLNIHSFNYTSQGLQKDNVHCGAWTLANIFTIDYYGKNQQLEHIERFYEHYLNPKQVEKHYDGLQFVLLSEEDYDEDYVIVDASDIEDCYEEMHIPDPVEVVHELLFQLKLDHFLPSYATIQQWESQILMRLQDIIHHEPSIVRLIAMRDNVKQHQHSLHPSQLTDIYLQDIINDIDNPFFSNRRYQIKDINRQTKRFVDLGFSEWINQQTPATQVIYEALLHDACSYEPMLNTLFTHLNWANQFNLASHCLNFYKQIEQSIAVKVIEGLKEAKPNWLIQVQTKPLTLNWLSSLLIVPQYNLAVTPYVLETLSSYLLEFDDMFKPSNF